MSPRTPTLPPNEPAMWKKLLARVHPDTGGDHDLFIWAGAVRDMVCASSSHAGVKPEPWDNPPRRGQEAPRPTHADDKVRITYTTGADFQSVTREALRIADDLGTFHQYGGLLSLLVDCEPMENYTRQQERGATYKQLAAIAHRVGMTKAERTGWYRLAESIPLAERHAGHLLSRMQRRAA